MKKILTFGVFDYFHIGHLNLFLQCKEYADYLIVAVQNGESILKYKPDANILYSTGQRIALVSALKIVKLLNMIAFLLKRLKRLILIYWH